MNSDSNNQLPLDELLRRRVQDAAVTPPPAVWEAVEKRLRRKKNGALPHPSNNSSPFASFLAGEEVMRNRLQQAEMPPPDFVWPAIESELRKRKRRRIIWIFLLLTALLGSAAYFYYRHKPAQQPDTPQPQVVAAPSSMPPASALQPNILPNASKPSESKTPAFQPIDAATSFGLANQKLKVARKFKKHLQKPVVLKENLIQEKLQETVFPENAESALPVMDVAPNLAVVNPLPNHPDNPLLYLRSETLQGVSVKLPKKKTQKRQCYDFARFPTAWMLEGYSGLTKSIKTLGVTDPEFKTYRDNRINSERYDWGFNAGVRVSRVFNRHFVVRTGLHYDQFVEIFSHIDPKKLKIIDNYEWQNGQYTYVSSDTLYGEAISKYYNRFGMLELPAQLGMELRYGRLGLGLHTGLSLNLLFWKRGGILQPDSNPGYFTPGQQGSKEMFKVRTGVSLMSSVQAFYHLNTHTRIFAEPFYRQIWQPVTHSGYPLEQRYSLWGLQLGISYILH